MRPPAAAAADAAPPIPPTPSSPEDPPSQVFTGGLQGHRCLLDGLVATVLSGVPQNIIQVPVFELHIHPVLEGIEGVKVTDEGPFIKGTTLEDQGDDVVVPMHPTALVAFGQVFQLMAGTEWEGLAYAINKASCLGWGSTGSGIGAHPSGTAYLRRSWP